MLKQLLFGGAGGGSKVADVGLLILRASIGLMLAFGHGMGKLSPAAREQMAGFLQTKGIPAPGAAAFAAMFAEFFGGLLLALGLLTRPAAFLIAFTMLVAVVTAHLHAGVAAAQIAALRRPLDGPLGVLLAVAGDGRRAHERQPR